MATSSTNALDKYLNDVLAKIYTNQNLCKLLYYDVTNPLSQADIADTTILKTDLENKRILTTPFTVDVSNTQKSTLTININESDVYKETYYKNIKIDFIILSHLHLWELDAATTSQTSLRPNLIVHELASLFLRENTIGIGKNHYAYLKKYQPSAWFAGYVYCLSGLDFALNN